MAAFPPELGEFKRQLVDLKTRSQQKIKNLTQLADELQTNYCHAVVQILNEEIKNAKIGRLQALFSLVDSILKKVSKEYKVQIGQSIGESFGICLARADDSNQEWLGKMVSLSWKKHGLLSDEVIADLERRLQNPQEVTLPTPSGSAEVEAEGAPYEQYDYPQQYASQYSQALPEPSMAWAPPPSDEIDAQKQRRLQILTKIVETRSVTPQEMSEITQVPEIRAAVALQQEGKKREAMELFMQFKHQLDGVARIPVAPQSRREEPPMKRPRVVDEFRANTESDGFHSEWVRQFLSQMGGSKASITAVGIGRRIVSQVSDQVAFADEMQPKEVYLLLNFIYMLETHLKKTIALDSDLSQRIPYSFSQLPLMLDPPSYGLIKANFIEYPYQCSTCGRRFSNQSSLSEHHDKHFRRNTALDKGVTQGWMESASSWVGKEVQLSDVGRRREEAQRAHKKLQQQRKKPDVPTVNLHVEEPKHEREPDNVILVESVPYNEGQPICPVCGEEFDLEWNAHFCDWGCRRAVALDPVTLEMIDFRTSAVADGGSARRCGDAIIYHRACADAA